jgi:hypothetical protein
MALLSMTWICSSALLAAQDESTAENPAKACSSEHKKDEAKVGKFVFKTYLSDDGACLEVIRSRKLILRRSCDSHMPYTLGQNEVDRVNKIPTIANGSDLTGSGHPEMIISWYSGGLHCCTERDIYELEPEFKKLVTIDNEDNAGGYFEDLGHHGHYYYLTADQTFEYWNGSYRSWATTTPVILKFVKGSNEGAFHLALKKMYKPAPTPEEWRETLKTSHEAFGADNPASGGIASWFWGNMLNLIYTGHSDLAWRLFDNTWPSERPGKDKFLTDFCSQLKTSPYWPDLEPTVQNAPSACANAKPDHTGR